MSYRRVIIYQTQHYGNGIFASLNSQGLAPYCKTSISQSNLQGWLGWRVKDKAMNLWALLYRVLAIIMSTQFPLCGVWDRDGLWRDSRRIMPRLQGIPPFFYDGKVGFNLRWENKNLEYVKFDQIKLSGALVLTLGLKANLESWTRFNQALV